MIILTINNNKSKGFLLKQIVLLDKDNCKQSFAIFCKKIDFELKLNNLNI